jgi:ATP-binding cassette subfamily F protein uup
VASGFGRKEAGQAATRRKKTYKEEREYEALPARIEALENEQRRLQEEAASPEFYKSGADRINAVLARIDEIHATLEDALARWVELEEIGR